MEAKQLLFITSTLTLGFTGTSSATEYFVTQATDDGTGLIPNTLSWAIFQANNNPGPDQITLNSDITINGVMKRVIDSDVEISSDTIRRTINGNHSFRPLFIKSGHVAINDIVITNGLAKGGDSGTGGAGAGLGGSLFIHSGHVTISDVTISNSRAIGGVSTGLLADGRHGGGMFGNASTYDSGGLFGTPYGGYGNYRNDDPFFGGSGGGGYYGDNGGFGGGGTYGGYEDFGGYRGGFGGGGGAGFSGYGYFGTGGPGGFGAGRGSIEYSNTYSAGEPGDGLGGAVFIRTGHINLTDLNITDNTASSPNGDGFGGGIYVLSSLNNPGNNHGMPDVLATVSACGIAFNNNQATSTSNTSQDNHDFYDTAQIINNNLINPATPCLVVKGNSQFILNNDQTPNHADNTLIGSTDINEPTAISKSFEIFNRSLKPVNISGLPSLTQPMADFIITETLSNTVIAPESSETFTIAFNPSSSGIKNAVVSFQHDSPSPTDYSFLIQGDAVDQEPEIELRGNNHTIVNGQTITSSIDNTDFGSISLSGTTDRSFRIHNTGNQNLLLSGMPAVAITGTGADSFAVTSEPGEITIPENGSSQFTIEFNPMSAGTKQATVEVENNDFDEGFYAFNIIGQANSGEIHLFGDGIEIMNNDMTPDSNNHTLYEPQKMTTSTHINQRHFFSIQNPGPGDLYFLSNPNVMISGPHKNDFYLDGAISLSNPLTTGNSTGFVIEFNPSEGGVRQAIVSIQSSDPSNPNFQFAIEGSGFYETTSQVNTFELTEGDEFVLNIFLDYFPGIDSAPFDITFDYELTVTEDTNAADFGINLTGSFTFLEGEDSAVFTIPTLTDDLIEQTESFELKVTSTSPHVLLNRTLQLSILDSETGDVYFKDGFE